MMDEKKKHEKEVEDLKEKDCPLSPTDWVMFLSSEIGRVERDRPAIITAIIAVQLAFLGVGVTVGVTHVLKPLDRFRLVILVLCFVFVVVLYLTYKFYDSRYIPKKVEPLEKIRKDIICEELTDPIKIRKKWEDATNSSCADKYSIELKKNAKE